MLEKTRQEQAVAEQKYFREAFLQAVEAEKEALLDMRRGSKQVTSSDHTNKTAMKPRHGTIGSSSVVECMQSKICSLQDELKAMRINQKENQREQLQTAMDHLSLQLQNLYTDAKNSSIEQEDREVLVENIRALVQKTIFAA